MRTTTDVGRKGLADEEQLSFALSQDRIIYTTDQDFLRLAHHYLKEGRNFAGIAYHQQGDCTKHQVIEALLLMNAFYDSGDMRNRVEFI